MIKTIKYFTFLSLISLCLILGFWQIDRGNEKSYIYNSYMSGLLEAPEHFNKLPDKPSQFTNVIIEKSIFSALPDKHFLLDNKVFERKAGYEVLSPILIDNKILLVNRGWVTNHNRQRLPNILNLNNNNLIGYVYYYGDAYELEEQKYSSVFPIVIQSIEIDEISNVLDAEVLPYILILSKSDNDNYTIQPKYKKNPELKHYMYAGQWFLFAIIGLVFMLILLRRDK